MNKGRQNNTIPEQREEETPAHSKGQSINFAQPMANTIVSHPQQPLGRPMIPQQQRAQTPTARFQPQPIPAGSRVVAPSMVPHGQYIQRTPQGVYRAPGFPSPNNPQFINQRQSQRSHSVNIIPNKQLSQSHTHMYPRQPQYVQPFSQTQNGFSHIPRNMIPQQQQMQQYAPQRLVLKQPQINLQLSPKGHDAIHHQHQYQNGQPAKRVQRVASPSPLRAPQIAFGVPHQSRHHVHQQASFQNVPQHMIPSRSLSQHHHPHHHSASQFLPVTQQVDSRGSFRQQPLLINNVQAQRAPSGRSVSVDRPQHAFQQPSSGATPMKHYRAPIFPTSPQSTLQQSSLSRSRAPQFASPQRVLSGSRPGPQPVFQQPANGKPSLQDTVKPTHILNPRGNQIRQPQKKQQDALGKVGSEFRSFLDSLI